MTDLKGLTALVTGSTSGIGKAAAIALAARGAHALVVGRDEQRAKYLVAEIEGSSGSATFRLTNQPMRSIHMSAYVIVEFTVKDPDVYREKYGPNAGRTAKEYGGEVLANSNWEILHGDGSLTSGALMRFPDHETAIKWYNSPEYQQLIDVRSVAMDVRFSLLDGIPS